mgnify:CR=1 FL=1
MNLRFADEHDAAACLAIYAQYIDTSITFETALPSEDEFAGRIRSYGAVYPWLIAEEEGKILAYAYAHRAQERAAYDWNAELSVYVSKNAAGRGLGTRLYRALLALLKERGVLDRFDGGVASCEVHINKPDPRIYQALLDKYGLKASECVFIDDNLANVQAAFTLGFVGIRMKESVGTLIRSLATCNVALRSPP